MIIDLHTHTHPKSSCSNLKPEELIRLSKQAGLDGICLTEHDTLWNPAETQRLAREYNFVILRGMEITTELGHVLVFGLYHRAAGFSRVKELHYAAKKAGAAMILAHPFRSTSQSRLHPQVMEMFHALEAINGTDPVTLNARTMEICSEFGLPGTAGSDCHDPSETGSCATYFENWISSEQELVTELKAGRCSPIYLRDGYQ